MTESSAASPDESRRDLTIIGLLAGFKLLIHLFANRGYGYFRDEFYYLACGERLAAGYVDHPPLIAFIAKFARVVFGESLSGLRLLPAVAGAAVVFLTGMLVRDLGGKRAAQVLACLALIVAPVYLAIDNFLSMNAFEHLFWLGAILVTVRIVRDDRPKLWPLFGVIVGFGLLNKHSMAFLVFGIVVGLALTPARKHLLDRRFWLGAVIAGLIFLPNLIWEIRNGAPTLEFMANARRFKNYAASPLEFLGGVLTESHPFALPLLLAGFVFYFFMKDGKPFRWLGWTYAAILALFIVQKAKTYYIAPALPVLLAGGSIALVAALARPRLTWAVPAYAVVLVLGGALLSPLVVPMLPIETFIAYSKRLGVEPPKSENHEKGLLPQHFADMYGWDTLTKTVAGVYAGLPEEDRKRCAIYVRNYGEAGSLEFFGRAYGLPPVLCGHNNYFLWGPGTASGEVLIVVGGKAEDHAKSYEEVTEVARTDNRYAMPYENDQPIFVCRRLRRPLAEIWPGVKHYN